MHIKFTRMEYINKGVYKESKESVWLPVEDLRRAIVRQEENHYRLIFGKRKEGEFSNSVIEVVKENPIELLKKYEEEQEEERKKLIKGLGRGSQ